MDIIDTIQIGEMLQYDNGLLKTLKPYNSEYNCALTVKDSETTETIASL